MPISLKRRLLEGKDAVLVTKQIVQIPWEVLDKFKHVTELSDWSPAPLWYIRGDGEPLKEQTT